MGSFSIWHWVIVLAVVLVLFGGGGKLSGMMGDLGTGIRALKNNLKGENNSSEDEEDVVDSPRKVGEKKTNSSKKNVKETSEGKNESKK